MPAQPVVPVGVPREQGTRLRVGEIGASFMLLHGPGIFSLLPVQPVLLTQSSQPEGQMVPPGPVHNSETHEPIPSSLFLKSGPRRSYRG